MNYRENVNNQSVMEKVYNITGSTAGANCGDYKRYLIRRQKEITAEKMLEKEKRNKEIQSLVEKNNKIIEEKMIGKTLKRRVKRLKKKGIISNNIQNLKTVDKNSELVENPIVNDVDLDKSNKFLLLRTPKEIETINNIEKFINKNEENFENNSGEGELDKEENNLKIVDVENDYF